MATFLTGNELRDAIQTITKEESPCCAVAFWGRGASKEFSKQGIRNARLICNLSQGGTNPFEIRKLKKSHAQVRLSENLHAKVYIGQARAVVTSANMSTNGLGLEGLEQARWIEAGVVLNDPSSVSKWFERLWDVCPEVTEDATQRAIDLWKERRDRKPTASSFADFDADAEPLPLITWTDDEKWNFDEESIKSQLGNYDESVEWQIMNGFDIDGEADENALEPGRWVLVWDRTNAAKQQGRPLSWIYTGKLIRNAGHYPGHPLSDVVLARTDPPPQPFVVDDKRFIDAFLKAIGKPKFALLKQREWKGAWFTKGRLMLIRQLWVEIKSNYD